jgi:capsular polysaccharide biosynthesis protein
LDTVEVYRALWRRRLLILLLTVLAVGATWVVVSREKKVYEATTLVRIQQRITNTGDAIGSLAVGQHLAQTYAKIVIAPSIEQRVVQLLGGRVPRTGVDIGASPVQDLELLSISARSHSPAQAALVANAAPVALRDFIQRTGTLRDQIITVDEARIPKKAVSPKVTLTVFVAFLLALIFSSVLALLVEWLGDRLPDPDELEAVLGKPVLATVPRVSFAKSDRKRGKAAEDGVRLSVDGATTNGAGAAAPQRGATLG